MRALILVGILALVVGTHAAVTYNGVSFCERYTAAVFTVSNSTTQQTLIQNVVYAVALGGQNVPAGFLKLGTAVGVFASETPFFNGSFPGPLTYVPLSVPANAANTGVLVTKLTQFFANALNCRAYVATFSPYTPANMKSVHATLPINAGIWADFVGTNLVGVLTAAGVSATDLTYAGNLMAQFQLGSAAQICNQVGCPTATGFGEFTSGLDANGALAWLTNDATPVNYVAVAASSNIHWNVGGVHCVVQTDSSGNVLSGGFASGAIGAVSSFNWAVPATPTATTYYFKCCNPGHTTMTGQIRVGTTGSGAAGVTASTGVVVAAIAAGFALSR